MEKKQYTAPTIEIQVVNIQSILEMSYSGQGDGTDIAAPLRPEGTSSEYSW